MGTIKGRNGKDLIEAEEINMNTQKNCIKKTLMTQIITMVQSLTQSQTFWSVKSSAA